VDPKFSSLHFYSKEPDTWHFLQAEQFSPRHKIIFLTSSLKLFTNLSLILPRRLFSSSFTIKICIHFLFPPSFPFVSKPSRRFFSCNFTNEYLLCFRVSYSPSKRIRCWKWMTTNDNIDKKYTARASTPDDLINWNSYVTFISESHITSAFHNSQALLCSQGRRQKKKKARSLDSIFVNLL